jgi:hypothetical protein
MNKLQPVSGNAVSEKASPDEQIVPGMTRQWLLDRQIVVFTMTSPSRDIVDAWIDTVKATMENWPGDRPYLAIHDLTSNKVSLTPYARKRTEELLPLSAKVPGYAAIVLSRSFMAQVIRLFLRSQKQQGVNNVVFFSRQEALEWLKSKIGTLPPHSNR